MRIKKSPSKFSAGVSSLWRGNDISTLNQFIWKTLTGRVGINGHDEVASDASPLLFESARSAIAATLLACKIGSGDDVIVSSFTCDAVTYAVCETGARVVYTDINDDLTMDEASVAAAITDRTKAIIVQNTFGRLGLQPSAITRFKSDGLLLIEDNCLSVGSSFNSVEFGSWGDVSVWSLEVSKTVTIGWGGVLNVNNVAYSDRINRYYYSLPKISTIQDVRRLFQLWFSVLMTSLKPPGGYILWYFLYGARLFRKSCSNHKSIKTTLKRLGSCSNALYRFMAPNFDLYFRRTHQNLEELECFATSLGLTCPVRRGVGEYLVAPRLSIIVDRYSVEKVMSIADQLGVEAGRWFSECPPNYKKIDCVVVSANKAREISGKVVNFPCHASMSFDEINVIKNCILRISELLN